MNYIEAKDETYSVFYQELLASAPAILGYVPQVRWHNVEERDAPDVSKFYIRAEFDVIEAEQSAFGCSEPGQQRMYAEQGLATFSIYAPRSVADSDRKSDLLASRLKTAFRRPNPPGEVWFRRERIFKTYPEDQFLKTLVTVSFYYTEVS